MIKGTTGYKPIEMPFRLHTSVQKIALPTAEGMQFEDLNQIVYLEASGNYTYIHFADARRILICKTLHEMAKKLEQPLRFVRIHRSSIINMTYLKKYVKGKGGYVVLENDISLAVSSGQKSLFIEAIRQVFR